MKQKTKNLIFIAISAFYGFICGALLPLSLAEFLAEAEPTELISWYIPISFAFFSATLLAGVFEKERGKGILKNLFTTSLLFLGSTICLLFARTGFSVFLTGDASSLLLPFSEIIGFVGIISFISGVTFLIYYLFKFRESITNVND